MAAGKFLIAPFQTGLEKDVRPWLLPEDAFEELRNMYVYRGRIRKRFGSQLLSDNDAEVDPSLAQLTSRARVSLGTTDGNGDLAGTVPGSIFKVGQMFSCGDEIFSVYQTGTPGAMLATGSATTHTYNTTNGAYDIQGSNATTEVFFYPAEPIMGITQYEAAAINDEPTFIFDTQFSYQFSGGGWARLGTAVWTGADDDFFWATTWRGTTASSNILFVSNFVTADGIQYWNGATWATLNPTFNAAGDTIETARIILPFKDRLVLLNVIENITAVDTTFGNRCRFSQNGSPLDASGWLEDTPGRGGFLDAPTQEQIITAEFLKDRLIVFFERSTWELVYTGNEVLPFRWQQINTELGAESTFSVVPFDKVIVGVGNVGIHACNGANVERIDDKIPDEVFEIHNENEGVKRVAGIRDYFVETVYWTFPSDDEDGTYPTRVLVYNYRTGAWAINDDSITAFGYFQNQNDKTWQNSIEEWQESDFPWSSALLQSQFRQVIAGNQQGFTFLIDPSNTRNSPALSIVDIDTGASELTIIDHNLKEGDYVAVENLSGTTADKTIYQIASVTSTTVVLEDATLTGTYTGGGTLARVSVPNIVSKQYNFYLKEGRDCEVTNIDFYLDKTVNGEFSLDYFASSSNSSLGTTMVETRPYDINFAPLEQSQEQIWHRAYVDCEGNNFQIQMYFSDDQMTDEDIAWSDFVIHAIMFHSSPTRFRLS